MCIRFGLRNKRCNVATHIRGWITLIQERILPMECWYPATCNMNDYMGCAETLIRWMKLLTGWLTSVALVFYVLEVFNVNSDLNYDSLFDAFFLFIIDYSDCYYLDKPTNTLHYNSYEVGSYNFNHSFQKASDNIYFKKRILHINCLKLYHSDLILFLQ